MPITEVKEDPIVLDQATLDALDEAEASYQRGEVVTLEAARSFARERYHEWLTTQQKREVSAVSR